MPLDRTLILAATADGEGFGDQGIARLIEARPEMLDAEVALVPGGLSLVDLLGAGHAVHAIATSEKGFAEIEIVALGPKRSGAIPPAETAPQRLGRALQRVRSLPERSRLTEPVAAFVDGIGAARGFPDRLVWTSSPLARRLTLTALEARPVTRAMITDTLSVTRLSAGRGGDVVPDRARATLRCHLLPGTTPGELKQRLEAAISDPDVFVTIKAGEAASTSAPSRAVMEIFEQVLGAEDGIVVPSLSLSATDARYLRRHGVAAYGYSPFLITGDELATVHSRNERLRHRVLDRGLRDMIAIVQRLAAPHDFALHRNVTREDSAAPLAPP